MSIHLALAPGNQDLRLISIEGGMCLRQRLADLGLTPGTILHRVQADGGGPLIIALKNDSRLALGRGMALKIMVEAETDHTARRQA